MDIQPAPSLPKLQTRKCNAAACPTTASALPFAKLQIQQEQFLVLERLSHAGPTPSLARIQQWGDATRGLGCSKLIIVESPLCEHEDFYLKLYDLQNRSARPLGFEAVAALKWLYDLHLCVHAPKYTWTVRIQNASQCTFVRSKDHNLRCSFDFEMLRPSFTSCNAPLETERGQGPEHLGSFQLLEARSPEALEIFQSAPAETFEHGITSLKCQNASKTWICFGALAPLAQTAGRVKIDYAIQDPVLFLPSLLRVLKLLWTRSPQFSSFLIESPYGTLKASREENSDEYIWLSIPCHYICQGWLYSP